MDAKISKSCCSISRYLLLSLRCRKIYRTLKLSGSLESLGLGNQSIFHGLRCDRLALPPFSRFAWARGAHLHQEQFLPGLLRALSQRMQHDPVPQKHWDGQRHVYFNHRSWLFSYWRLSKELWESSEKVRSELPEIHVSAHRQSMNSGHSAVNDIVFEPAYWNTAVGNKRPHKVLKLHLQYPNTEIALTLTISQITLLK